MRLETSVLVLLELHGAVIVECKKVRIGMEEFLPLFIFIEVAYKNSLNMGTPAALLRRFVIHHNEAS